MTGSISAHPSLLNTMSLVMLWVPRDDLQVAHLNLQAECGTIGGTYVAAVISTQSPAGLMNTCPGGPCQNQHRSSSQSWRP